MKRRDFEKLLKRRLQLTRDTLSRKRDEYAPGEDVLRNFKRGAELLGTSPSHVCLQYMTKHLVSLMDIEDSGNTTLLDEKLGDIMCYMVLLEACLSDLESDTGIPPSQSRLHRDNART